MARKKRKTSKLPTRVYKYALLPPVAGDEAPGATHEVASPEDVDRAFEAALVHRDELVKIEIRRRREFRATRAKIFPDLVKLEEDERVLQEKLGSVRAAVNAAKVAAKSRKVDPATRAEVHKLRDALRSLRATLKKERRLANESPELEQAGARADDEARAAVKALRKSTYWGTYLLCEEQAAQTSGSRRDPELDRTPPHLASSRVGVHFMRGISEADLATNNLMRIFPMPAFRTRKKSGVVFASGRAARTTLWFRIGSTAKRRPVFARFPMVMHRHLPPGCLVKDAYVTRRPGGVRVPWLYGLCVVLESADLERRMPCLDQEGTAAVNFGWRLVDGELRVALINRGDRGFEEIRLPAWFLGGHEKCRDLQKILDEKFDAAKAEIASWIAGRPKTAEEFFAELRNFLRDEVEAATKELARYEDLDDLTSPKWSMPFSSMIKLVADELESAKSLAASAAEEAKKDPRSATPCEDVLDAVHRIVERAQASASCWEPSREEWRESLQLALDDAFETLTSRLREWKTSHAVLPAAFIESFANLPRWKSQHRLAELAWYWRGHRLPGDDVIFEAAARWLDSYRHLRDWEVNMRRRLADWRSNYYRRWAKKLATTSATLVVDTFKISSVAKKNPPEEEEVGGKTAGRNRVLAAPGLLRTMILEAAAKYHSAVVAAETANKTRQCSSCGFVHPEAVVELDHACESPAGCGALWDQDVNNTDNLLDDHEGGRVVPLVRPARSDGGVVEASSREGFGAIREKVRRLVK